MDKFCNFDDLCGLGSGGPPAAGPFQPYRDRGSRGWYSGLHGQGLAEGPDPCGAASGIEGDPLRIIHVSLAMIPAGIDKWLTALINYTDAHRARFLRCVVTSDFIDWKQLTRVGVPVEIGGRDSIRRACADCDVLLISDPGENPDWLDEVRARLCVFVAHGDGPWTRARLERLAPAIDHVVAVSNRVQEKVCAGFSTTVIPNGVDPRHLMRSRPRHAVRASFGFQTEDFVLGFAGRFSPEKNPFAVIEAVALLPQHCKALLVGFGPLRDELVRRANELIPGRYAIVKGDDDMGDLYASMDAFCLASHQEGFGLVIMEAMMCGKPVIVTDIGFVPDAIADRVNGIVVNGDPESISAAVVDLDARRDWAASMGREAREYAERTGYASTMADRYADLFEALWASRSASRGVE